MKNGPPPDKGGPEKAQSKPHEKTICKILAVRKHKNHAASPAARNPVGRSALGPPADHAGTCRSAFTPG
jgi:hypothetical protein